MSDPTYYRLEIEPCIQADGHIEPGVDPDEAEFWGVYGRRNDSDLVDHLRDCRNLSEARSFATTFRPELPVHERCVTR